MFSLLLTTLLNPQWLSTETKMSMDFEACEQMRHSGWQEKEIKTFMLENKGFYDKDYLPHQS